MKLSMFEKNPPPPRFRFLTLKTHASNEWLADGRKRYRSVYDVGQVSYLYAGLTFLNLEYGWQEWEAAVTITCHTVGSNWEAKNLVCTLEKKIPVTPDSTNFAVHEGWGSPNVGGFWTAGTYVWTAFINGEEVGKTYFYLQAVGLVTPTFNPYFKVVSVRLFEDNINPNTPASRHYYSTFKSSQTRYIWTEFTFENLEQEAGWMYELDFKFFTQARELKGSNIQLNYVERGQRHMTIVGGWGSDTAGTWHPGFFTAEVAFMGQIVAVLPFEVGPEFVADSGDGKQWRPWNFSHWSQGH